MTSTSLRVGVVGARGRMGTAVAAAVSGSPDLDLVAAIDLGDGLAELADARCDVMVDFTRPDAVLGHVSFAVEHGIHAVVGTSGVGEEQLAALRPLLAEQPGIAVVVIPNFAVGAMLAERFARQAAPLFDSVELLDMHHADKLDAPSGTASAIARAIAAARQAADSPAMPDATIDELAGARGAIVDGVRIHSLRMPGLVAQTRIVFGKAGEVFTIDHNTFDRSSFMPTVLAVVRRAVQLPGLTVGLEAALFD